MQNRAVSRLLEQIAAALEFHGDNPFRVHAYREAAQNVAYLREPIEELAAKGQLENIPGVGPSIAAKIQEFLATGHSSYLETVSGRIPPGVYDLMRVPGLGPRKIHALFGHLGISNLAQLEQAARRRQIRTVPGMGAKTEAHILKELERLKERGQRLPLGVAWSLADQVAAAISGQPGLRQVEPAGSIRRRRDTIGDIDLLVAAWHADAVLQAVNRLPFTQEVLSAGEQKISFLTTDHFQIDLLIVDPGAWGAALVYFTGSKAHNIALRERAMQRGYKLNEHGLFRLDSGVRIAGATETEVYEKLGLAWIPPELREDNGEIEAASQGKLPRLVSEPDVRGDLHTHTIYSDGRNTLEEMAAAAIRRGYRYLAITDHSFGLGVARGLTREKVCRQRQEIDRLNQRLAPFRLIHGVELEIRANGQLDFPDEILAQFDLVTASIHSGFQQSAEQITQRMVGALRHPLVDVLNHPTGRLINRRAPYEFEWERVLRAAHDHHKALEIDGSPDRLDLNDPQARRAKEMGILLSLSSDAHSVEGLDAMRLAVAIARRAWLEPQDVLNSRLPDAFLRPINRTA